MFLSAATTICSIAVLSSFYFSIFQCKAAMLQSSNTTTTVATSFDCQWTLSEAFPDKEYWANAMSGDGTLQAASASFSSLFLSNDTGYRNVQEFTDFVTLGVAMSKDGRFITTTGLGVNVSRDAGKTWITAVKDEATFPISMSYSGKYQTTVSYLIDESHYIIYASEDWGTSFKRQNITTDNPFVTANGMSGDGRIQVLGIRSNDSWISTDYGNSFRRHAFPGVIDSAITGISLSWNGQYQVLGADFALYVSDDFGASWKVVYDNSGIEGSQYFYSSTITPNGEYMMATNASNYMISTDHGSTWNVGQNAKNVDFLLWIDLTDDASKAMMTDIYGRGIYEGVCGWTTTYTTDVLVAVTAEVPVGPAASLP